MTESGRSDAPDLREFREGSERFVRRFNEGGFDRAAAGLAGDYVQRSPPGFPETEIRGRKAWDPATPAPQDDERRSTHREGG